MGDLARPFPAGHDLYARHLSWLRQVHVRNAATRTLCIIIRTLHLLIIDVDRIRPFSVPFASRKPVACSYNTCPDPYSCSASVPRYRVTTCSTRHSHDCRQPGYAHGIGPEQDGWY